MRESKPCTRADGAIDGIGCERTVPVVRPRAAVQHALVIQGVESGQSKSDCFLSRSAFASLPKVPSPPSPFHTDTHTQRQLKENETLQQQQQQQQQRQQQQHEMQSKKNKRERHGLVASARRCRPGANQSGYMLPLQMASTASSNVVHRRTIGFAFLGLGVTSLT